MRGSFPRSHSLSKPTEVTAALKDLLSEVSSLIARKNIIIKPYCEEAWAYFHTLPETRRHFIYDQMIPYREIVAQGISASAGNIDTTLTEEIDLVNLAFEEWGLQLMDDFFDYVKERDIIEIYTSEGVQLYRNFEFFKKCSYSLLDLITQEWYTLYERCSTMTDAVMKTTADVIANQFSTIPYTIPNHTLRERYLHANNVFDMKMKFISPLTSTVTGKKVAFIHTLTAAPIPVGAMSDSLHFL